MAIYEQMQAQLQELMDLVKQDEQYTAAVAYGALQADRDNARAHRSVQLASSN
ncbi:hypothetical protein [Pseudomonas sp. DP16D-R1]|jgi:hypothetical protein|uniref:hypothetical protein n=1 Tax=Pseudomonas sp. DP16D-R1 TaxID=2075551 RepID=UPI001304FE19|nr:hypothetical protein [Pseudomonas sp. DP16D-R1]